MTRNILDALTWVGLAVIVATFLTPVNGSRGACALRVVASEVEMPTEQTRQAWIDELDACFEV